MLKNQKKINRIALTIITVCLLLVIVGFVWNILSKWDKDPLSGFDWRFGFCEASFTLADESRLPKWVNLPMGVARSDVQIDFFYFIKNIKVVASNNTSGQIFFTATTDLIRHPVTVERSESTPNDWPCPSFITVSIDGINEVIAHVEQGDIVYIAEQSQVTPNIYNDEKVKKRCETFRYYQD